MTLRVDCDVHPAVPSIAALRPHLDPFWAAHLAERGFDGLESMLFPPSAPTSARADFRDAGGRPPSDAAAVGASVFGRHGVDRAILNPTFPVTMLFNEDMAVALARALNDWIRAEWLDRDPRLRAAIVVPLQSVEAAVAEIERLAADPRFVQVRVPAMTPEPPGQRRWWPIWRACARHRLPLAIHAGSAYRQPPTSIGWPGHLAEEEAAQSQAFQSALASLVTEGVFGAVPDLTVVLVESGVTWLPAFLWRIDKFWRALRPEVPWVDRPPSAIVRERVRLTAQPFDAPDDPATVARILSMVDAPHALLFASDHPHWRFDGDDPVPPGFPADLVRRMLTDNPLSTYPRLREAAAWTA
ncbi:MAG: amidohydrolase family protein [Rhodospirillales bacterium]